MKEINQLGKDIISVYSQLQSQISDLLFSENKNKYSLIENYLLSTLNYSINWSREFVRKCYEQARTKAENKILTKLSGRKRKELNHDIFINFKIKSLIKRFQKVSRSIERIIKLYQDTEKEVDKKLLQVQFFRKIDFRKREIGKKVDREVKKGLTTLERWTKTTLIPYKYRATLSLGEIKKNIKSVFRELFGEINFIQIRMKNGKLRNYKLKTYIQMVTRTEIREIQSRATISTCKEYENDLIAFSSHSNPCSLCEPFDGQTFSISGKHPIYPKLDDAAPLHPHCNHGMEPTSEDELFVREKYGFKNPEPLPKGYNIETRMLELRGD